MIPQRQTIFVADNPKGRGNCQSAAMASVLGLPLDQVIDTASDEVRAGGFWEPIYAWLAERGLKIITVPPGDTRLKGAYSIAAGPSPRGPFYHAVVCKNGVMVFDPHPSDDGLIEIARHDIIVPMTDVEKKMHHSRGRE
ncbi:hypothetical protein [Mesorhizobium sp. M0088]|uniref:hypothetical protein n=1 Tax=Mesorhizobium sp. M0088 TaxID=2956873 RepID=UPI003335D4CA